VTEFHPQIHTPHWNHHNEVSISCIVHRPTSAWKFPLSSWSNHLVNVPLSFRPDLVRHTGHCPFRLDLAWSSSIDGLNDN
jgi:hypothetical protein